MASTKDYHYMEPSLTQTYCHHSLSGKNDADLSPMDLDFSSAMNLNSSNDIAQAERQCSHDLHYQQQQQQQQQQGLPSTFQVTRNSSFRLPSFASLISGRPSHSVPRRDRLASSSTAHPYSAATQSSLHLPRLEYLANRLPTSSEYSVQQPVGPSHSLTAAPTRQSDASSSVSMTCDNNRACYVTQPPVPPTSDSILTTSIIDTSPTPTPAKKGRRTRKPKFISRILNANMQWPTYNSKNSDATSFRPYQYEHRRSSQQQQQQRQYQQQQQEGRRRRISSVGTTSSLASSAHVSSSTTTVGSSPSSSTAPSVISTSSATMVKPRWQETERLELLKAIVKEKQLDDMTTFSWDRISLAVGRGTKSCKDQFRREILPALLKKLK